MPAAWRPACDGPPRPCGGTTEIARPGRLRRDSGDRRDSGCRSEHGLVEGRYRRATRTPDRHERGDASCRRPPKRRLPTASISPSPAKGARSRRSGAWFPPRRGELNLITAGRRRPRNSNGVRLMVTTSDPAAGREAQGARLHGDLMVLGSHHQAHHLLMAKGERSSPRRQHPRRQVGLLRQHGA